MLEETLVSVERMGLLFVYVLATIIFLVAMFRAYTQRGKEGGLPAEAGFFRLGGCCIHLDIIHRSVGRNGGYCRRQESRSWWWLFRFGCSFVFE